LGKGEMLLRDIIDLDTMAAALIPPPPPSRPRPSRRAAGGRGGRAAGGEGEAEGEAGEANISLAAMEQELAQRSRPDKTPSPSRRSTSRCTSGWRPE
jgi:hypothetical protein